MRRAAAYTFTPPKLQVPDFPSGMCSFCPACSDAADADGAPLLPGLEKTDHRNPLLCVAGDGCSKCFHDPYAGVAQAGIKPVFREFFGDANDEVAALLKAGSPAAAAHSVPMDKACGSNLTCIKQHAISGKTSDRDTIIGANCPHGLPIKGKYIDGAVHGARVAACGVRRLWLRADHPCAAECSLMYDVQIKHLKLERKVRFYFLDNGCIYKRHYRHLFSDKELEILVPWVHALGHGWVRAHALFAPSCMQLSHSRAWQACQCRDCGLYHAYTGRRHGETNENVWWELKPLWHLTRHMALVRRCMRASPATR